MLRKVSYTSKGGGVYQFGALWPIPSGPPPPKKKDFAGDIFERKILYNNPKKDISKFTL